MKILYIANHNQTNSNDDEGAIAYALEKLGHTVYRVPEERGDQECRKFRDASVCLFHKWDDPDSLDWLKGKMIRVFYYFDLVEFPDPTLEGRNQTRRQWMERIIPSIDIGFCTDGDWVRKRNGDGMGKLVWMMQGCDERIAKPVKPIGPTCDILFTGISKKGGHGREQFVQSMANKYGHMFHHVQRGVHGKELANLIASAKVVVAPNSPVSNCYWSNRAYLSLGFGACLVHPLCDRLMDHYEADKEIIYYEGMNDLYHKIDLLLPSPQRRYSLSTKGWEKTIGEHTYRHRLEKMMTLIKEKM